MAKHLPTHIFSAHLLVLAMVAIVLPCTAHEGEASGLFDIVASQRFEQRADGVDSHVALLGTLDEFRDQIDRSHLPVVVKFSNISARAWGGNRELYQDLAGDYVGKVLFMSVDVARSEEILTRFMQLFLQLALQARGKTDHYSIALRRRLAVLMQQMVALRKGRSTQVYLFFKDGNLIIPQAKSYEKIEALRGDVRTQLLGSHRAQVVKVPSPWHTTHAAAVQVALQHCGDVHAIAKRLRLNTAKTLFVSNN